MAKKKRSKPDASRAAVRPRKPAEGALLLSMAIASVSKKVKVDASGRKPITEPRNLAELTLDSPQVGIDTPAAVRQLKANLTKLIPEAAAGVAGIPESPDLAIGDLARYVDQAIRQGAGRSRTTPGADLAPWPAPSRITVLTQSAETLMREKVKNHYGKAFSEKCSADVARVLSKAADRAGKAAAGLEFLGAPGGEPQAMVLEFAALEPGLATAPAATRAMAALDAAHSEIVRLGARQMRISHLRDEGLRQMAGVCSHLERSARRTFGALREGLAAPAAGISVVEVCWLNNTVRSRVPPRMVAEVAEDSKVDRIDMPRRLSRELNVSSVTVGGPAFRTAFGVGGAGVVVAVIDSEIDVTHPALAGRVIQAKDFTVEGFGSPDAHGTGVAGIIGGRHASLGGIAPEVTIRNYKVLATNRDLNADDFGGALALQAALEDGAQVANCSWGAGAVQDRKSREAKACDAAWENGMVVVKSAGNKGPGASTMTTPADADGIIVVGATDRKGKRVQDYSSRGTAAGKPRPHMVAPGGTRTDGVQTCQPGGGFGAQTGTSFAAPHVTGMVALLLEQDANATPDGIRRTLIGKCKPFSANKEHVHGAGLARL